MAEPIEVLAQYPVLQYALVAGTFLGGAIAVWRAVAGKPSKGTDSNDLLQGIYRELVQQGKDNQRYATERNQKLDRSNDLLSDIKNRQPVRRT